MDRERCNETVRDGHRCKHRAVVDGRCRKHAERHMEAPTCDHDWRPWDSHEGDERLHKGCRKCGVVRCVETIDDAREAVAQRAPADPVETARNAAARYLSGHLPDGQTILDPVKLADAILAALAGRIVPEGCVVVPADYLKQCPLPRQLPREAGETPS